MPEKRKPIAPDVVSIKVELNEGDIELIIAALDVVSPDDADGIIHAQWLANQFREAHRSTKWKRGK